MGLKSVIIFSLQLLGIVLSKSVSKGNLQVEVTKEVKCKENQKAHEGDKVTVHYGGFLQDGNLLCLFLSINNSNSSQCAIYNVISLTLAEECGSLISWYMVQGTGHVPLMPRRVVSVQCPKTIIILFTCIAYQRTRQEVAANKFYMNNIFYL